MGGKSTGQEGEVEASPEDGLRRPGPRGAQDQVYTSFLGHECCWHGCWSGPHLPMGLASAVLPVLAVRDWPRGGLVRALRPEWQDHSSSWLKPKPKLISTHDTGVAWSRFHVLCNLLLS